MSIAEEDLEHIAQIYDLALLVVLDGSGQQVAQLGRAKDCPSGGIVSALLGPQGDPKNTVRFLENRILPQIYTQGDALAYLDKPAEDCVVVIFEKTPRPEIGDPATRARWTHARSREVAGALRRRIGASELA